MTKLFAANNELQARIIGRSYPQIVTSDNKKLFEENGKRIQEEKFNTLPKERYSVKITKSVKLTDMMSSFLTPHSLIISEKLVNLLSKYSIPENKIIPLDIYRNKELVTEKIYFIMHFWGNEIPNVNFKKSTFDYYTGGAGVILDRTILHFKDYDEFLVKREKDESIYMAYIQRVVMKTSLRRDLFFLDILDPSIIFVTDELKETLEDEKITGFRFEEIGLIDD